MELRAVPTRSHWRTATKFAERLSNFTDEVRRRLSKGGHGAGAGMILEQLGITEVVVQRVDGLMAANVHHLEEICPRFAADVRKPARKL